MRFLTFPLSQRGEHGSETHLSVLLFFHSNIMSVLIKLVLCWLQPALALLDTFRKWMFVYWLLCVCSVVWNWKTLCGNRIGLGFEMIFWWIKCIVTGFWSLRMLNHACENADEAHQRHLKVIWFDLRCRFTYYLSQLADGTFDLNILLAAHRPKFTVIKFNSMLFYCS